MHGGTITGTVKARGAPDGRGRGRAAAMPTRSRRYKYVERLDYDQLRDFVVYVDSPVAASTVRRRRSNRR